MKVQSIPAEDLTSELLALWRQILRNNPSLASPYFSPDYVQIAAKIRGNVEVGVISDGGKVVGFFPFERHNGSIARPVGGNMCDYQAVIADVNCPWTVKDILSGCHLKAWFFDHQLACQQQLSPYFSCTPLSPVMDLSAGFDAYLASRRASSPAGWSEALRKFRKLQRDYELHFEWHTNDDGVFNRLLRWKSEQYLASGLLDHLKEQWRVDLLARIWRTQSSGFGGVLSAVYASGSLAAVHFSMQSGRHLHSWFPAYNVELAKYSPGGGLLLLMAQHASGHGIDFIDLGKGPEGYKKMFASGGVPLAEGAVDTRFVTRIRRSAGKCRRGLKRFVLRERP